MIRYEADERMDREYTATVLWSIGKMLGGNNYSIPAYSEMKSPKPQDNRSSEAILMNLQEKLKGGVRNGGNGIVPVGG